MHTCRHSYVHMPVHSYKMYNFSFVFALLSFLSFLFHIHISSLLSFSYCCCCRCRRRLTHTATRSDTHALTHTCIHTHTRTHTQRARPAAVAFFRFVSFRLSLYTLLPYILFVRCRCEKKKRIGLYNRNCTRSFYMYVCGTFNSEFCSIFCSF